MTDLPPLALSVRQPWAWAIVHAGKDIENRGAFATRYFIHRGPFCVHASLGMTRDEYDDAAEFMDDIGVACPPACELLRGGIIGTANFGEIVKASTSSWFFGPCGLVLTDQKPVDFVPSSGQLGFFKWTPSGGAGAEPAKWMLPKIEKQPPLPLEPMPEATGTLI